MSNKVALGFTALFVLFLVAASVLSIYREGALFIPGLAPTVFKKGDPVQLKVNKITSVHQPIPYRYNDLPVCSTGTIEAESENIGSIITGNRVESSDFKLKFLEDNMCQLLCKQEMTNKQVQHLAELIKFEYKAQWLVDDLPAAVKMVSKDAQPFYETGFLLGQSKGDKTDYYNHIHILIHYHPHRSPSATQTSQDEFNIVMFEVHAFSIDYGKEDEIKGKCEKVFDPKAEMAPFELTKETGNQTVFYTYTAQWTLNANIDWSQRWHSYVSLQGSGPVHWFSIVNSLMIIFFMSGMIAAILAKTLRRDFIKMEDEDELEEETGWKLLHADVFRPPIWPDFLCVLVGSGTQIIFMVVISMVFSVLGFLSPANQGSLMTAMLVLYVWMGVAAGYTSSRLYQIFEGVRTMRNTLVTAFFFPGLIFTISFVLNIFLENLGSSGAFSASTMAALVALWFCISVPLCYLGSRLAYNREPIKLPGKKPNLIPRPIPPQKWYSNSFFTTLIGGIIPFGAVFIELSFIMSSIWLHRFYFLFGFLFLVLLILFITCAEISIVLCYFQLCSLDWQWWWKSFLSSGTSAFYMFLYAIYYYTKLDIDGFVATLIYFGYTTILCLGFFVFTGTIGFGGTFFFVKKIYGAVHQD